MEVCQQWGHHGGVSAVGDIMEVCQQWGASWRCVSSGDIMEVCQQWGHHGGVSAVGDRGRGTYSAATIAPTTITASVNWTGNLSFFL